MWPILACILLLAAFLRLDRICSLPWGLSQDEVGNASISLSLLAGEGAPFLAGGFGHEPLFHYLQAATLTLFGDNVLGIRMPAVAAGMVLVSASYALMRALFGPVAAAGTAVGLAISWWPVIFSRIGIRAITFPLLLTLALLLLWHGLRQHRQTLVLSSGLLFGLTAYTYTAARVLPGLALAWLAHAALFQREGLRHRWRALAGAGLVAALVAAPLVLYLCTRPELQERVGQLEGPLVALQQGDPGPLAQGVLSTLTMFSRNGEARWTYSIPGRPILGPASGLLFYLGLIRCLVQIRRPACGMVALWLIVTLVPSMVTPDAPSSIRAIGALPAAYGMIGLGAAWLWEWVRPRGRLLRTCLLAGLSIVGLAHLAWTYQDGFGTWASHHEVYWLYKSHFADIAAYLDSQPAPQPAVVFEAWVDPVDINGVRRDLIHDDRQPRWAQAGRAFIWPADAGSFTLAMPIYSSADAEIWQRFAGDPPVVAVSPYHMPDGRPGVTFYAVDSEPARTDFLAQAATAPVTLPGDAQPIPLPVDLGDRVAFLGYQVVEPPVPGEGLRLITAWRVLRDAPQPLNVFVHVLDPAGHLVAQYDGFDIWAATMKQGDVVAQLCAIPLDAGTPSGPYILQAGAYNRADMVRLPVLVAGQQAADMLWLGTVEVNP